MTGEKQDTTAAAERRKQLRMAGDWLLSLADIHGSDSTEVKQFLSENDHDPAFMDLADALLTLVRFKEADPDSPEMTQFRSQLSEMCQKLFPPER